VSDEQPKTGGDLKASAFELLRFIDSPFKLMVVLLLSVVGYAGYFWHQNHELFIGAYLKQRELPKLNPARYDDVAEVLFKKTGADMVAIFTVDPILNKRISARAYQSDGSREQRVEDIDVGLFTHDQRNNLDVVALLSGEVPCSQYSMPQSEIGLWYMAIGVSYTCRVSVPPEISQFIGQITVGWKMQPPEQDMEFITNVMQVTAKALTK
jgi:hypothetical protein